jgi:hypothetical protein
MQRATFGSAVAVLWLVLACASGGSPKTDVTIAPDADVAAFASFSLQSAGGSASEASAPLSIADANVQKAIRERLVLKGYREVATNPDLIIRFETAAYVAEKVKSPMRIGLGVGSFGGPVGVGVGTSAPVGGGVTTAQETRLTIRAIDPQQNKELWVGTTTGIQTQHLDASGAALAVADTLAEFPARPN